MGLNETFDLGTQLEEKMAECYKEMSRLCQDEALARQFMMLSDEEIGHRNLLITGKNYLKEAPDIFHLRQERIVELQIGLNKIIRLVEMIRDKKVGLEEALNEAAELERFFEQFHLKSIADVDDESLKKLFEALSAQDKAHRLRLVHILERFYGAS